MTDIKTCRQCIGMKETGADKMICSINNIYLTSEQVDAPNTCPEFTDSPEEAQKDRKVITYDVVEHYGVFDNSGEWIGEVNLISWNGNREKIDIRYWHRSRLRSRKISTLSREAAQALGNILSKI